MFNWAKKRNLILTYDWDDYTLEKPIMKLEGITTKQIQDFHKLMYRSFYFRPNYIIRKLLKIKSFNDLKISLSGLNVLLSFLKKKTKNNNLLL